MFIFGEVWTILKTAMRKLKVLRYALGFAAIAAAVAIGSSVLRGYMSQISAVVVAVNMGVMLMIAVLMARFASRTAGTHARQYAKLYLLLAWLFSLILIVSACLSLSSVFFHYPVDFRDPSAVETNYAGDYRIEETVTFMNLKHRVPTMGVPGAVSRDIKYRIDRIVKQRQTSVPYEMQWGTNGSNIVDFKSATHPGMQVREEQSKRFNLTTKHTYIASIPADQIPFNFKTDVRVEGTFINAFENDTEEWVGSCPNIETMALTMIVLFPDSKPAKEAVAMEQPTGSSEIPYRGTSAPVIHDGGRMVSWTVAHPVKGVGYFIAFKW
jgi:hypothetical protein